MNVTFSLVHNYQPDSHELENAIGHSCAQSKMAAQYYFTSWSLNVGQTIQSNLSVLLDIVINRGMSQR